MDRINSKPQLEDKNIVPQVAKILTSPGISQSITRTAPPMVAFWMKIVQFPFADTNRLTPADLNPFALKSLYGFKFKRDFLIYNTTIHIGILQLFFTFLNRGRCLPGKRFCCSSEARKSDATNTCYPGSLWP
jgi:hypothetical protein